MSAFIFLIAAANVSGRTLLYPQLNSPAQLAIAIEFDFDSARIKPKSYRAIDLIADGLHHPAFYGYCFLIVGHTDATGRREYNLRPSERRALAVQQALANPFGISPRRVEEVGLGEEQIARSASSQVGGQSTRSAHQYRSDTQRSAVSGRSSARYQIAFRPDLPTLLWAALGIRGNQKTPIKGADEFYCSIRPLTVPGRARLVARLTNAAKRQ